MPHPHDDRGQVYLHRQPQQAEPQSTPAPTTTAAATPSHDHREPGPTGQGAGQPFAAPSPDSASSMPPPSNTKNQAAFVPKLYSMVEDVNIQHLIAWTSTGDVFSVFNPTEFSRTVLPQYFKHNNWQSFVRQLNMYGFHKVNDMFSSASSGSEMQAWEFQHPSFQRGRPDLLQSIKRKSSKANHVNSAAQAAANHAALAAAAAERRPPPIAELGSHPLRNPHPYLPPSSRSRNPSVVAESAGPLPSPQHYRGPSDLGPRRGSAASGADGYYPPMQESAAYHHSSSSERGLVPSPRHSHHPPNLSPAAMPSAPLSTDRGQPNGSNASAQSGGPFNQPYPGGPGSLAAIHSVRPAPLQAQEEYRMEVVGRHVAELEGQIRVLGETLHHVQQENRQQTFHLCNALIRVVAGLADGEGNGTMGDGQEKEVQRRQDLDYAHKTIAKLKDDADRDIRMYQAAGPHPSSFRPVLVTNGLISSAPNSAGLPPISPADAYGPDSSLYPPNSNSHAPIYSRHRAESSTSAGPPPPINPPNSQRYYSPPGQQPSTAYHNASPPPSRSGRNVYPPSDRLSPTSSSAGAGGRWSHQAHPSSRDDQLHPPSHRSSVSGQGSNQLPQTSRSAWSSEREQREPERDRAEAHQSSGWDRSQAVRSTPSLHNILNDHQPRGGVGGTRRRRDEDDEEQVGMRQMGEPEGLGVDAEGEDGERKRMRR